MKTKLLIAAVFVLTFAVLVQHFEQPVLAQVRAALVKNVDERGRSPYTVKIACSPVPQSNYCQGNAPSAVPANKRFVLEYVNGNITTIGGRMGGGFVSGLYASSSLTLDPHLTDTTDGFYTYVINMPVVAYSDPGKTPSVLITSVNGSVTPYAAITLNGYLAELSE